MNEAKKVAVFQWGQISIHTYYLVQQLHQSNVQVDLFLYTPVFANKPFYLADLVRKLNGIVTVFEIKCTATEASIIKLNRVAKFLRLPVPLLCINPFLPGKTRKIFDAAHYSSIITIAQASLFWLYKTDKHALSKAIHYSLEVERTIDPNVPKYSCMHAMVQQEAELLPSVDRLIIQDKDRAHALLGCLQLEQKVKTLYYPVSVPGAQIDQTSSYLHEVLNIPADKKIILYFGAIYRQRLIEEMIEACENMQTDEYVFVLHGAGDFGHLISKPERVKASNQMVGFDDIDKIISSANIAFSFYDNALVNNKLTAFSSEKIARYLQAGVPFVAIKNENYLRLKNEFDCCILVEGFHEIESAVHTLGSNYEYYRKNAFDAYDKYFNIASAIKPLLHHINHSSN
jgi:glycosyltransferase involved in cell wall biosynthesis